jgi:hypothetical protein
VVKKHWKIAISYAIWMRANVATQNVKPVNAAAETTVNALNMRDAHIPRPNRYFTVTVPGKRPNCVPKHHLTMNAAKKAMGIDTGIVQMVIVRVSVVRVHVQ